MEQQSNQDRPRGRMAGLRGLIYEAIDAALELPPEAIRASVDAVVDKVGSLAGTPNVEEVTKIVVDALEKAGEGAGAAAEAAADIAGSIVDGLGDLNPG